MVAEMWSSGYWITPLEVSIAGTTIVDVIRWRGISDAKRSEIAAIGLKMFGDPALCTRNTAPSFVSGGLRGFCGIPYAYEGITGDGDSRSIETRFRTSCIRSGQTGGGQTKNDLFRIHRLGVLERGLGSSGDALVDEFRECRNHKQYESA